MRAIRRSEKHEGLVRQLTETQDPMARRPVFMTMRELLCFAAVLGFECGKERELEKATKEIDGRTFEGHDKTRDLMYVIALAHQKEADILRDENDDKLVGIFEKYVEGGLEEITLWMAQRPDDPIGDRAIIDGMRRSGYLEQARPIGAAIQDVTF